MIVWLVYLAGIILSCAMAWAMGANDASNPTDCAVGAGVISLRKAIVLFAIFAALGGILIGPFVMKTFDRGLVDRKTGFETGVLDRESLVLGSLVAALSAVIWVALSTWLGMPVSTTHSAIGGILGFGIITCPQLIVWDKLKQVGMAIILSPLLSAILAVAFFRVTKNLFSKGSRNRILLVTSLIVFFILFATSASIAQIFLKDVGKVVVISATASVAGSAVILSLLRSRMRGRDWSGEALAFLLVFSLAFSAFAFGANDLANATGVFVTPTEILTGRPTQTTMFLLALLGSAFIAIGGLTWGYRVIATAAYKITKLDPLTGFSAELANALTVFLFSTVPAWLTGFGIPVSTTQSSIGSIVGVGLAAGGLGSIHKGTTNKILMFWILTIPCTALISMGIFKLFSWVVV